MKYIIRSGKVKGEGRYMPAISESRPFRLEWPHTRIEAARFDSLTEAERAIACHPMAWSTRIVPLLSADEAKRKAKATMLRELSYAYAYVSDDDLLKKADELWPAKGER